MYLISIQLFNVFTTINSPGKIKTKPEINPDNVFFHLWYDSDISYAHDKIVISLWLGQQSVICDKRTQFVVRMASNRGRKVSVLPLLCLYKNMKPNILLS